MSGPENVMEARYWPPVKPPPLRVPTCPAGNSLTARHAGRLPAVRLLPDPSFFGTGFWQHLRNLVAVVPVIMTA